MPPEPEIQRSKTLSLFDPDEPTDTGRPETTGMFAIRGPLPPEPETTVVVRVVAGPDMVRYAVVPEDGTLTIGRDPTCGLVLDHPSISRRHAAVALSPWGEITVHDLGSTNGTWRGTQPIQGAQILEPGDRVDIGRVAVRVERLGPEEMAHLARVAEKIRSASHDPLTGLVTRRWLDEELAECVESHRARGAPLTALFIDIDHFKSINDTFGHATGDDVLRGVARLVVYAIRSGDVAVRYGGEEVVVFLRGCDTQAAYAVAERLRKSVATHAWCTHGLGERKVTVSCGIAELAGGERPVDWLKRADAALYAAKSGGRNRTMVAG